ncbi:MAG: ATP-binding protein [Aureliella sp.]
MHCAQKLKRLRSELTELSEQWVVHRLAGDLLQRTIDRFTRDHEPQLLKHTRRFFHELTDRRYGVVEHDSGKHGGFAVRDQQGHAWQPDKLSTGTREQLYLAIRLAFVTHFNEQHEPLPVIMDDCFVNFDDTRSRIALRTLLHWRESAQTILLSCHWRSVEALAELAPETPVIALNSGELTTARNLAERAEDFVASKPTARLPI